MSTPELHSLQERAKELRCLYRVHEILSRRDQPPTQTFLSVLEALPQGWQRPSSTGGKIEYLGRAYVGPGYTATGQSIIAPIRLGSTEVGYLEISDAFATTDDAALFLPEEAELLRNVAQRLGEYLEWKHTELLGDRVPTTTIHWRWREAYAHALARALDPQRFGVQALFLSGSTERGEAGPGSDIDMIVVFDGTAEQRDALSAWFEGWSLCLAELARQQTGYRFDGGLLNLQWARQLPDTRRRFDLRSLPLAGGETTP